MWPFSKKSKELNSAELRAHFFAQCQWAQKLVADFSDYVEYTDLGVNIRDVSKLPWKKDDVLRAFTLMFAVLPEGEEREACKIVSTSFAYFQPNVGQEDISMMPMIMEAPVDVDPNDAMAAILAHSEQHTAYQSFLGRVDGDLEMLKALYDQPPVHRA